VTNLPEPPPEGAGIESLRLDADRTRDEIDEILAELEERLNPRRLVDFAQRQWSERPAVVIAIGVAAVAAIGGLIARSYKSHG
jgi:hypothetical protein